MTTCQWCVGAKKWQEEQEKLDERATTIPSAHYIKECNVLMNLYKFCNEKCECETEEEDSSTDEDAIEVHEVEVTGMLATYYWNEESKDLYNTDGIIIGKTTTEPTAVLIEGRFTNRFNYRDISFFRRNNNN